MHKLKVDTSILSELINKVSGSIYVVQNKSIVFHNPHFSKLTGYSSEELCSMEFIDLVHQKDKKLIKLLFSNNFREISIKKSHSFTYRISCKNGEMRWLKSNVSIIKWEGNAALLDNCFDITQQKQFEDKLVEEEKNFRLLVNAFEDMTFIISKRDTIVQANKSAFERLGYTEQELILKSFSGLHPTSEQESVKSMLLKAQMGNRILYTGQILAKNGKPTPIEARLFFGNWSQKEIVFAICQDISVRIESERIIRLSEEKFSKAFENNAVMMTISTLNEGKYIDVNDTFLKVIGLNRKNVIGKTTRELGIFPAIDQRERLIKMVITHGKSQNLETTMINAKGQTLICQFSAEIIDIQATPCLLVVLVDITLRKQSEQRIIQSEQRFRQLAELLPEMAFEANSKGRITFANNYLLSFLGLMPKKLKNGIYIRNLFSETSKSTIAKYTKNSKKQPELPSIELIAVKENGDEFPALTHITAVIENGKVSRYMGIMVDISVRKQQEIELIRAKKLAEEASLAKEKFLSTMSHEIRTPMNGIIGITNILLEEEPKKSQFQNLQTLKYSAENLMALLNDILDFSKMEAGKLKINRTQISISQIAQGIYNTFKYIAQNKNIELRLNIDNEIPANLSGDPVRINQIISNLMANAIKFTDTGFVELNISLQKMLKNSVQVRFSITDTGIGISTEKQNLIFEEFTQANIDTTRKYGGTGLGLAISERLVNLLGGKLEVKSTLGKGSTFFFTLNLPITKISKPSHTFSNLEQADNFKQGYNVLVVEDNSINSMIVINFLKKWGFNTELAENGLEALTLVKKMNFDLILMDLEMPVMNGYEATTEIRKLKNKLKNSIPIIALTASAMLDVQNKIFSLGMNGFVLKPFNPAELKKKIAEIINA
ncbi:MAG TPA: PAS domain S-box protein [Tenuifilaceae bacterium]|nr:PAS domain S-box protein [Tenuifilaceae bacterium]HPJ44626.1 PAS domain S-box protein [Tenuifilaceae bacterium]HPQ33972.1 PAS domain S-box protein [Tenuifilaceae bacterium]